MKRILIILLFPLICFGQTNSIVTELYLANNFTPKSGITPGSNNTLAMDCDQITTRYSVSISGTTSTGQRLPSQNQLSASCPSVGDSYQGGIVAYLFVSGDPGYVAGQCHGIIISSSDLGCSYPWVTGSYVLINTTSSSIGEAINNTNEIYAIQGSGSTYAARACYDYTSGVYSDWGLPTLNELIKINLNKVAIGIGSSIYWSSSEIDINEAHNLRMSDGTEQNGDKFGTVCVRAVRYF